LNCRQVTFITSSVQQNMWWCTIPWSLATYRDLLLQNFTTARKHPYISLSSCCYFCSFKSLSSKHHVPTSVSRCPSGNSVMVLRLGLKFLSFKCAFLLFRNVVEHELLINVVQQLRHLQHCMYGFACLMYCSGCVGKWHKCGMMHNEMIINWGMTVQSCNCPTSSAKQ